MAYIAISIPRGDERMYICSVAERGTTEKREVKGFSSDEELLQHLNDTEARKPDLIILSSEGKSTETLLAIQRSEHYRIPCIVRYKEDFDREMIMLGRGIPLNVLASLNSIRAVVADALGEPRS